jgi:hypothetical protein
VAETSSARGALIAEEVMELATCWYIDFPGVGVIDLEAPQLLEKVLEVVMERMFTKSMIIETIASVSKALKEYERADGFGPAVAAEAADAALEAPAVEPIVDAPVPPPAVESHEASLPQVVGVAEALAPVTEASAAEAIVGEVGSLPPRPVAADAGDVETRMHDEPAATVQELAAPETMIGASSLEIQEVEGTGASLSKSAAGGEAQSLELTCTSWAATSWLGVDCEDDEEVAAHNTLEHGLTWVRRAFDELILPTTSVSFLVEG